MTRYMEGDRRAFDLLFVRHAGRMHGFFVRHGADRARADDFLQTTWLHVHRARATFDRTARFAPWLYTIANNVRCDEGRRAARDKADLTRDGGLPEKAAGQGSGSGLDREDARRVQAAVSALPESQREVIVLHRWMDLGFGEIAEMLGTTEGAVKLRAHRGYLALRQSLLEPGGVAGDER